MVRLARMNAALLEDEDHRRRKSIEDLEARMRAWLAGEYTAVLFDLGAEPIAYALFRADEDESIFLRQFFVARELRRSGLGRRAFELLRRDVLPAGARIVIEVLVGNATAISFWRAMGFTEYAATFELR